MKKISKVILTGILTITMMCNFNIFSSAAAVVYDDVETERIASIPTVTIDGDKYTGVGGMAIATVKNSMFICKASSDEEYALFYYFPEVEEKDNYAVYRIPCAGHANGMTIDGGYIYITGWCSTSSNAPSGNPYNNWIIRIPRSTISSMSFNKNGNILPADNTSTTTEEGYSIIYPKIKNVASNGTVTYSNYTRPIMRITKYGQSNRFIIDYNETLSGLGTADFAFTIANIETAANGNRYLVVSQSQNDIFVIKNNMINKGPTRQDIAYSSANGFFFNTWCGTNSNGGSTNRCKSIILWIDIDNGEYEQKTYGSKTVKYYTPSKININKAGVTSYGVTKYDTFELESLAFNADNELIFNCNIIYTDEYINAYKADKGVSPQADGVFKLTHDNGQNFLV